MKPIAPMSKAEKDKRKMAKAMKTIEEKKKEAGPPADCRSLSGAHYFGSPPDHWKYMPGAGWLHQSETTWFDVHYRVDIQTSQYHRKIDMLPVDGGGFIHKTTLKLGTYVIDLGTGRVMLKSDCFEVRDANGVPSWATKKALVGKHYFECAVTHDLYSASAMRYYKFPATPGWNRISCHAITKVVPELFCNCPQCGELTENKGIFVRPGIAGPMCPECFHNATVANIIHEYNHKGYPEKLSSEPKLKLLVKDKLVDVPDESHRLFGVECEVEIADKSPFDRWTLALQVRDALGKDFVVMKNDGSLKEHSKDSPLWGFEIVSAPADMAVHTERWAKLESMEGFQYLRAWQTITCGMHVHIGKSALSALQIGRILVFINSPKNRKFIEVVAGRNSKAASRFIGEKTLADGLKPDPDKYCAVNIKPEHTIEFRIFRGTIRYKHIMRNLEFCDAVCAYCYPASRSLKDVHDYKKFIEFCKENRKRYPLFTHWMENYNYVPARKLPPGRTIEEVVEATPVVTESQGKWY